MKPHAELKEPQEEICKMANRIVDNTIIVDSAMGNSFILNSANRPVHIDEFKITSISLWSTDTTGIVQLSAISTADIIVKLQNPFHVPSTISQNFGVQRFTNLKVPTLTAGTAFIQLA